MNNTTANMPLKDSLKPSPLALLPIGVFLVIYAGSGIIFHDFYNMPAIIAFLETLTDVLKAGDKISLKGFGTFEVRTREARMGRNHGNKCRNDFRTGTDCGRYQ